MRSLFLKILLWFWLAMALVVLALVASTASTPPAGNSPRWRSIIHRSISIHAQNAVQVYEQMGESELSDYIRRVNEAARFESFLFDQGGQELSRQSVPHEAKKMASRVISSGSGQFEFLETHLLVGLNALGPNGRTYALIVDFPRKGRLVIPGLMILFGSQVRSFVLCLATVLLTAGIVCYWLARYLAAPVVRLRAATHKLAAGDLRARVGVVGYRKDELVELGKDFDQMAEQIESAVTAQKRLLVDISHELRTPLARLTVAVGIMRQQLGAAVPTELDRIEKEADRINALISQLLVLTRIESGAQDFEEREVDLYSLVREIASDADFEAKNSNRSVSLVRYEPCSTIGVPALLRSAIENVVRNAIRHTAEGTQVELSLHYQTDGVLPKAVIRVRDHGPGVPESALREIFQPFYRVSDARDRATGGMGLGLSITERVVGHHGGTVRASNIPGDGLLVEIRLPAEFVSLALSDQNQQPEDQNPNQLPQESVHE
jgi:two-component system, OmpR family, sensor histidine kinase CpxA